MKKIALSGKYGLGKSTIVDDDMFDYLNQWKWHCTIQGYAKRLTYNRLRKSYDSLFLHSLVVAKPNKRFEVDHINRNKLDNRRCNLRLVSHQQNNINKDLQSNNRSGYQGIHWYEVRNEWIAYINFNKKRIHLGYFKDIQQAILARKNGEKTYFGEFAR